MLQLIVLAPKLDMCDSGQLTYHIVHAECRKYHQNINANNVIGDFICREDEEKEEEPVPVKKTRQRSIEQEFSLGTKLKVKYGRGRNQKIYTAKVSISTFFTSSVYTLKHLKFGSRALKITIGLSLCGCFPHHNF